MCRTCTTWLTEAKLALRSLYTYVVKHARINLGQVCCLYTLKQNLLLADWSNYGGVRALTCIVDTCSLWCSMLFHVKLLPKGRVCCNSCRVKANRYPAILLQIQTCKHTNILIWYKTVCKATPLEIYIQAHQLKQEYEYSATQVVFGSDHSSDYT